MMNILQGSMNPAASDQKPVTSDTKLARMGNQ